MRIVVDRNRCTGIGMCESIMPEVFEINEDGQLTQHSETVPEGQENQAREAVASCPNEALSLEN